jgi:hypothetical protein
MKYQLTKMGWIGLCPEIGQEGCYQLQDFRSVSRLPGGAPPIYQIRCRCQLCQDEHEMLATQGELDIIPLQESLPPLYDFINKEYRWDPEVWHGWGDKIVKGLWPMQLHCRKCGTQPSWPSQLREIRELTLGGYLVYHQCTRCQGDVSTQLSGRQFVYPRV